MYCLPVSEGEEAGLRCSVPCGGAVFPSEGSAGRRSVSGLPRCLLARPWSFATRLLVPCEQFQRKKEVTVHHFCHILSAICEGLHPGRLRGGVLKGENLGGTRLGTILEAAVTARKSEGTLNSDKLENK